ncbi:hypothetical protein ACQ4M4_12695 [Leptolyngbya sp. AN02str]|uniref:hypothetical protein n=1 Tax=Leptolyngbya sp. AN02str TaxID=3423363 RepID=UPI003D320431
MNLTFPELREAERLIQEYLQCITDPHQQTTMRGVFGKLNSVERCLLIQKLYPKQQKPVADLWRAAQDEEAESA